VRESEALIVRECARRLLAGEALQAICADLNERGVATVTGVQWKTQTLRRMLTSPRISGQREHRGEIVGPAEWPAIITPAETARIRALLSDPSRRTNKSARRYLLVRLLRCGLCGELLVSRPTATGKRRYVCAQRPNFTGCGHMYIEADMLELFVVEAVLHRLDSPELAAVMNGAKGDPDAERAQVEIEQAQAQMDELAAAMQCVHAACESVRRRRMHDEHRTVRTMGNTLAHASECADTVQAAGTEDQKVGQR